MMNLRDRVRWGIVTDEPITAHGFRVTPQSWSLTIQLPWGGFVWNRPVAIIVDEHERITVVDVTRRAQVALLIVVMTLGAAYNYFSRTKQD